MGWLTQKAWSPYLAGGLVGLLNWFAIATVDPLGASTTFARTAVMIERIFVPGHVARLTYFQKYGPMIDWQWMLVLGIVIGAFVSSRLSGEYEARFVPRMWVERFGPGRLKRWIVGFIGGIFLMFGARMAGG